MYNKEYAEINDLFEKIWEITGHDFTPTLETANSKCANMKL